MKEEFLKLYDETIDDLFEYTLNKTGNKSLAKSIVKQSYALLWDNSVSEYPIATAKDMLYGITSRLIKNSLTSISHHHFMPAFR